VPDLPERLPDTGLPGADRRHRERGVVVEQMEKVLAHHAGGTENSNADLVHGINSGNDFSIKIKKAGEKNKGGMRCTSRRREQS